GGVCTMGSRKGKATVIALRDKDGKGLWVTEVGDGGRATGSMCTPTIDGDRVYAVSGDGELVCLKVATGKRVCGKSFKSDYDGRTQQFGSEFLTAKSVWKKGRGPGFAPHPPRARPAGR